LTAFTPNLTDTSTAILDAAERMFALHGFNGASMRQIANEAGVAQALLHYHFDSKEKLFETMFVRRSDEINSARIKMLDSLLARHGTPMLEDLLEALLKPAITFGHEGSAGNLFSRVLAATANANDERSRKLIATHYDHIARRFIEAFQRVLPQLTQDNAVWAYMFVIGMGITMMADTGRTRRLSEGHCNDSQAQVVLAHLIPFACAGIKALAATDNKS